MLLCLRDRGIIYSGQHYLSLYTRPKERSPASTCTPLFRTHTSMSRRTAEEKDQRRVSSTAQGKRKCTGGVATSSRSTPRTSGRSNQSVNTVPRYQDYVYPTVKTSSRSNSGNIDSPTRTAEEQMSTSADKDVGTPPTTRTSLGPARQEVSRYNIFRSSGSFSASRKKLKLLALYTEHRLAAVKVF